MKRVFYFLNIFFIFSIIGFILETIFIKDYQSGILYLPWTPIYGIAVLIALPIKNKLGNMYKKPMEIFLFLLLTMIILSGLEFIAGYSIEYIFNEIYWNYDYLKFNIGRYIALEMALIWGIGSAISVYLLLPLFKKAEKYIPWWLTIILTGLFLIDITVTFVVQMS